MTSDQDIHTRLTKELQSRYQLSVSPDWLTNFLSTIRNPPPPLGALVSTANFRILASDITTSLSATTSISTIFFPPDINDINVKERRLSTSTNVTIIAQVLDIQDVSTSKWSQVEAIERIERGEEIRGREVIRNVPIMNEDDDGGQSNAVPVATKRSFGPHKLVLQDAKGMKVTAFELVKVPKIEIEVGDEGNSGGMCIGCKMALKSETIVRRGLLMLTPEHVTVLGGKVEVWDKRFRQARKERLIKDVQEAAEVPRGAS